ncbi:hypothetical protein SAMN06265219_101206 [Gracilimonas mengyeensis]|uniref:Uncharacterized protein n=2 Tax=Gracilimonas mengyeensis TaxID=1302730 RepID=A0A521AKH9_9BACT|nr:hypothetical protein SAMN06265219_101206 [Gracilimonas mengyeensis]
MRKKISTASVLSVSIISFLLVSCGTPYQALDFWGHGFSERKLSEQSYLVSFSGNESTSAIEVQNLLLRRCAELTLSEGYNYFLILDEKSDKKTSLSYIESSEEYSRDEEYTKSVQIYMANRDELTKEELRQAIDARVYLAYNK